MKLIKKILPYFLILFISYWSIKPLLYNGFFPMHDDTQVARVFEMHKSLKDGMFPVRWVSDLGYGYGYPIFNFYAPFAYYIGAIFMFLGFDALIATKAMIGLAILLSGIFMYFLAKEFWGKIGGVVASVLYVYAPYHALNAYVRGAISELWAYGILPLLFLGIYKIYTNLVILSGLEKSSKLKAQSSKLEFKTKNSIWWWVSLSGISYAAIILSHNLTAMMITPFIFVFAFYLYIRARLNGKMHKPYYIVLGLLIGILLSAFYWLPVPLEMKYTDVLSVVGGGSDYSDHFVCFSQLWNSPWGFAGSAPGCLDGFSLKIGKLHIALGLLSLLLFGVLKKKNKRNILIVFWIFLLFSLFLTLSPSKFIWDSIPHMAFFQFPWRFLAVITFLLSFLAGGFFWFINQYEDKKTYPYFSLFVAILSVIVLLYSNVKLFAPSEFLNVSTNYYTNPQVLKYKTSKISDEYMPSGFFKPLRAIDIPRQKVETKDKVKISQIIEKTQELSFITDSDKKSRLYINTAYFPGWHVFLDGKQIWFNYSGQGLIIDVPEGNHKLTIKYTQTLIEKIGNIVSLGGCFVLIAGIISHRRKSYGKKNT